MLDALDIFIIVFDKMVFHGLTLLLGWAVLCQSAAWKVMTDLEGPINNRTVTY